MVPILAVNTTLLPPNIPEIETVGAVTNPTPTSVISISFIDPVPASDIPRSEFSPNLPPGENTTPVFTTELALETKPVILSFRSKSIEDIKYLSGLEPPK